jgi:hypothetical protein
MNPGQAALCPGHAAALFRKVSRKDAKARKTIREERFSPLVGAFA